VIEKSTLLQKKPHRPASDRRAAASDALLLVAQKEKTMLSVRLCQPRPFSIVAVVLILLASIGALTTTASAKAGISATLDLLNPVTLGGTPIKPGTYTVSADDTKVTILKNGKAVAQANVQWKDTDQKAATTNIFVEGGAIKEIHFGGKTRYAIIMG
jgi:hypothetical protein